MFENDERFQALERERDRRDLFDDHLEELRQKVYFFSSVLMCLCYLYTMDVHTCLTSLSSERNIKSALVGHALFYLPFS